MPAEEVEQLVDGAIGVDRSHQPGRIVGHQGAGQGEQPLAGGPLRRRHHLGARPVGAGSADVPVGRPPAGAPPPAADRPGPAPAATMESGRRPHPAPRPATPAATARRPPRPSTPPAWSAGAVPASHRPGGARRSRPARRPPATPARGPGAPEVMSQQGGQRARSAERRTVPADDQVGRSEPGEHGGQPAGQPDLVAGQRRVRRATRPRPGGRRPRSRSSAGALARVRAAPGHPPDRCARGPRPGAGRLRRSPIPRPPRPAVRPRRRRPAGRAPGRRHPRPSGRIAWDRRAPRL